MNPDQQTDVPRLCLRLLLLIGIGAIVVGTVLVLALPYFQLDVVLTEKELDDEAKMASTLAMLEKASGNTWLLWSGFGIAVTALSSVGLWKLRDERLKSGTVVVKPVLVVELACQQRGRVRTPNRTRTGDGDGRQRAW